MSTHRTCATPPPPWRDGQGRWHCRWCGEVCPGRRTCWCSQECVEEYLVRKTPGYARRKVFARDHGVCAICGTDASEAGWHMDHITPVVEGGGECGLENLRTLCVQCHRTVTAELARRRARARRAA